MKTGCCIFIILCTIKGLYSNKCNFNVHVMQALHGDGFHRNLTFGVVFHSEHNENIWHNCIIGLDQELPSGVFVNPDELNDLRRVNKVNAIPKNRVNIELPSEQSSESNVFIIGGVTDGRVYLWIPTHARYHHAVSGGGTKRNQIGPPTVYLRCPDERLDVCGKTLSPVKFLCNGSSKEKCNWKKTPFTMVSDTVIWDVPVGNTDHYYLVAVGTATVLIVGSLYLLNSIHGYKVNVKKKNT